MKITHRITAVMMTALLTLTACHTNKGVVKDKPITTPTPAQAELIDKVVEHAQKNTTYFGSKLKFSVEAGKQKISVSGSLRMKRDDVIRLQLTALGLFEAARLEFTRDSVLIMDRINKQYLKAPYNDVDFLRDSGINFHMLQALFWNELFQPGETEVDVSRFAVTKQQGDEATINFAGTDDGGVKSRMAYNWLVNVATGSIKHTQVEYDGRSHGKTSLNWEYSDFKDVKSKPFPTNMQVLLSTPKKKIKLDMKLSSFNNDDDWETRTQVSRRYSQVDVDEILRRVMAL